MRKIQSRQNFGGNRRTGSRSAFRLYVTSLIDYRWVRWGALPMYLAGLAFLILTDSSAESLRRPQLAPSRAGEFSAGAARRHCGIMVLSLFLSQFRADASDASPDALWRDRGRALFADS